MLRSVVGCAVGMLACVTIACSDATNPTSDLTRRAKRLEAVALTVMPNVHTTVIPAFDNPDFLPKAFNDLDEIVGDSANFTPFKWQSTSGFVTLHLAGQLANAWGVNDDGEVVFSTIGNGVPPFNGTVGTWDRFGNVRLLPGLSPQAQCLPNDDHNQAYVDVNNAGVIVGQCAGGGLPTPGIATLWTPFGNPEGLVLGDASSISDAGYISVDNQGNGSVFTPAKVNVPLLPAGLAYPFAVNDRGWAAGRVLDTITVLGFVAAVWTRNDSVHTFASGPGEMRGLSPDGIAVGEIQDPITLQLVPAIWTAANGFQRLPGLGGGAGESGEAIAINARHQILGFINLGIGDTRWVIWTLLF